MNNYYSPESCIWQGSVPDLYCSFSVHKLHKSDTYLGHVRILVAIEHDLIFDHIDYQNTIDLTYTDAELDMLLEQEMLIENIRTHYLMAESMQRDLHEYFH